MLLAVLGGGVAPPGDSSAGGPAIALAVFVAVALVALLLVVLVLAWPWRVAASLKSSARASAISLAGGVDVAGLAASGAAILGGPGVLAAHFRGREVWRRPIASVSLDPMFDWIDAQLSKPKEPPSRCGRALRRAKDWLFARTDLAGLPGLGLGLLGALRDVELRGDVTCGFADPAVTGKVAAWLFPLAGVLRPYGTLEVRLDWSGKTVLEADVEIAFRVRPARVLLVLLRFARDHVHMLRKRAISSTMAASTPS